MFTSQRPSLRELAVQALSSVERGYDLLAPKFDHTPFRTPDSVLDAVAAVLETTGPYENGLDLCCGTGAGMDVLARVCRTGITGVDISAGMLAVGRERTRGGQPPRTGPGARDVTGSGGPGHGRDGGREPAPADGRPARPGTGSLTGPGAAGAARAGGEPRVAWVRGDARALPFPAAFDLVVSFGAFGHFLPAELPGLFGQVHSVLRPGGRFVFPVAAPAPPTSPWYWAMLGFDAVMRVRNAVRRPPFVMYYRTFRLGEVRRELERAGFAVELHVLPEFGRRRDGGPRCRAVVATRPDAARHPAEGSVNS
ncbi:methyltransferase domain-containing protein [Streptomyces sp. NPDC008313]|uniref:class I SAM-dependent methyltransferase n=1 Tax=Streptomyces sp. NPDC008313 TaxID=3364826 RepID=UPI0036EDD413